MRHFFWYPFKKKKKKNKGKRGKVCPELHHDGALQAPEEEMAFEQ